MQNLTINRSARFTLLPTAVFLLALSVSFATVGQTQDAPQTTAAAATAAATVAAEQLRDSMRDQARDAAWRTRIAVASDLSARLNDQHHARRRLASRYQGTRG